MPDGPGHPPPAPDAGGVPVAAAPGPVPDPAPAAVVVLAAGAGTRMRSRRPKVLHTVAGRSLLGHAVHAAAGLRPEHLVVVVGHGRELLEAEVGALAAEVGRPVRTVTQHQQQGTGHAVGCAVDALDAPAGTVVVTCADVPLLDTATLAGLVGDHVGDARSATVLTTELADPAGYGRILRDGPDGAVLGIVEEPDATPAQRATTEVNAGVYAFDGELLAVALQKLTTANAQGELYLTDVLGIARESGGRVGALRCADGWLVRGVNDRVQLAEAHAELNRRLLEGWMRAGVTVVDPRTTWVDVTVTLEPDVVLRPGTQLHGRTSVGEGAEIGPDSTLTDCAVGAGASVVRTHASSSVVGPDASVGPFAYLRPGVSLGAGGKIGTFVEVKNSEIGAGSKVPHLTYVGDATVGEQSNIGASSVVVNYDGVRKHRTVIGSHVRTGSDTTFVAPVTVGDGAYTGAGTVLREDVPPGALAVSAGRQRTIEGWVAKNRPGTVAAQAAEAAQAAAGQLADEPADAPGGRPG